MSPFSEQKYICAGMKHFYNFTIMLIYDFRFIPQNTVQVLLYDFWIQFVSSKKTILVSILIKDTCVRGECRKLIERIDVLDDFKNIFRHEDSLKTSSTAGEIDSSYPNKITQCHSACSASTHSTGMIDCKLEIKRFSWWIVGWFQESLLGLLSVWSPLISVSHLSLLSRRAIELWETKERLAMSDHKPAVPANEVDIKSRRAHECCWEGTAERWRL